MAGCKERRRSTVKKRTVVRRLMRRCMGVRLQACECLASLEGSAARDRRGVHSKKWGER